MEIKDRVLVVEDDKNIRKFMQTILEANDYDVIATETGKEAYSLITSRCPDVVILDLGLPDMDGMKILKEVRAWSNMPIIVVSARDHEKDKVEALDMGADDYIGKPFRPRELVSRIKSVLRRSGRISNFIELADVRIDTTGGKVTKSGEEIFLSALEYRLLLIFAANKGNVLSRNKLLEEIWDASGEFVNDNTLTVYIKRLREKIENDPQRPEIIKTVRGMGYRCL